MFKMNANNLEARIDQLQYIIDTKLDDLSHMMYCRTKNTFTSFK